MNPLIHSGAYGDKPRVSPEERARLVHEGCLLLLGIKVKEAIQFFENIKHQDLHFRAMLLFVCDFQVIYPRSSSSVDSLLQLWILHQIMSRKIKSVTRLIK